MNLRCPVCMRPLPADPTAVKLYRAAGSRPLFAVHRERCADVVEATCYVGARALLAGARDALAKRAPLVSAIVERYAAVRRGELRP